MSGAPRHLRLVHPKRPILSRDQLAHFATPKTWREIRDIDPSQTREWWREAVIDSDEAGFGLVMWLRSEKRRAGKREAERFKGAWTLTLKGRAYVAGLRSAA